MRRAVAGAIASGARRFAYVPDTHQIASSALQEFAEDITVDATESTRSATAMDTTRGAQALKDLNCGAVITLGGDGTNRAFALGWRDAPLVPISTGTNNVFPELIEATIAGAAAGLVSSGNVKIAEVATPAKVISVEIEGEADDLALIDAVLSRDRFIGARALLEADKLETALMTRADPTGVGITAIGGLTQPLTSAEDAALLLQLGPNGRAVRAPIAPGMYQSVAISDKQRIEFGRTVEVQGPGVLAFDGERERALRPGQKARLTVHRDGPWVIDVKRALSLAVCRNVFEETRSAS